jgi:hypothetical protein
MSLYQVQKCLFDYLRAKGHAPPDNKPEILNSGEARSDVAAKDWSRE